jgi:hypothetical protein
MGPDASGDAAVSSQLRGLMGDAAQPTGVPGGGNSGMSPMQYLASVGLCLSPVRLPSVCVTTCYLRVLLPPPPAFTFLCCFVSWLLSAAVGLLCVVAADVVASVCTGVHDAPTAWRPCASAAVGRHAGVQCCSTGPLSPAHVHPRRALRHQPSHRHRVVPGTTCVQQPVVYPCCVYACCWLPVVL